MNDPVKNRYEFVYLFDVENGNPNGDPDAGNLPRIDPETNHGLVTDVCLKRKIRNYVSVTKKYQPPHDIYVKEKAVLNLVHKKAYESLGLNLKSDGKGRKGSAEDVEKAKKWMCKNFYDVRTFGAVMSTGINCGQVRGPVQLNFGRSTEPILPLEITITRMAVATEEEARNQAGDNRTMGRKSIVPYALYRSEGYISAFLAEQTGFSESDLELFWQALIGMFDHDHSAARGKMSARNLFVFRHENKLGAAPAYELFDLVTVKRDGDTQKPARNFQDYKISIGSESLPKGVELLNKL